MAEDPTNGTEKPLPMVGSYRLVRSLGAGGMSSVFQAVHAETGLEVALKILPRGLAKNPTLLQRFLREAKSAESLEHPNIAAIYDRGTDQGRHYLVLEYVAGGDLHDRVRTGGPYDVAEAVATVRAVAEGLRYAATRGVIHRDIKPANILVTPDGQVKVADLGLALQAEGEDERVTREGTTVGTVDYMAPEQARDSRATSVRSDIYSLGCTFYFLLTGQPPFPGGEIPDKLARHVLAARPDPRDFRPEVPPEVTSLIRKMMATRAEQRFPTYEALTAAIDALPASGIRVELAATLVPDQPTLFALIDDEDDPEAGVPLPPVRVESAPPRPAGLEMPADLPSLGDLVGLDDEPQAPTVGRRLPFLASPAQRVDREFPLDDEPPDLEDGAVDSRDLTLAAGAAARGMNPHERSWVLTCVFLGLAAFLVIVGADLLLRGSPSGGENDLPDAEAGGELEFGPPQESLAVVVKPQPLKTPRNRDTERVATQPPARSAWHEPSDVAPSQAPERRFDASTEDRLYPAWARADLLPTSSRSSVRVSPLEPQGRLTLRAALDVRDASTVELASTGPYFASDLRFVGESRVIRAAPGCRPIVVLEPLRGAAITQASAFLDLGEKVLACVGIDFVVDLEEFPDALNTLFLCRGGTLLLRECSVTALNRSGHALSLVRTGPASRPSRVRLERTLLRGVFTAALDLGDGPAEAVLARSLVFNGLGAGIADSAKGASPAQRRLAIYRSLVCCSGAAFERVGGPGGNWPRPVSVRVLGSTFAHFQTADTRSLITSLADSQDSASLAVVEWLGDANAYHGWSGWLSTGRTRVPRVRGLAEARRSWPATDPTSTEGRAGWPVPPSPELVRPDQLRDFAPQRHDVLALLPAPNPFLLERSIDTFPRPARPTLRTDGDPSVLNSGGVPGPRRLGGPRSARIGPAAATGSGPSSPSKAAVTSDGTAPGGLRDLAFDTLSYGGNGDLGAFLAAQVRPDDRLVRVTVSGSGQHPFSRFRVPDGVSLQVTVEPNAAGQVPSWQGVSGTQAEALLETRGGTLLLSGLRLSRDGQAGLRSLVRVERGHLILERCRLTAPGAVEEGGGRLLDFVAPGSQPLAGDEPANPFASAVDRPTCWVSESVLITGGDALAALVGRGGLFLEQCAVAAGGAAFRLNPSPVARARFDADLSLDHCTVAAERSFLEVGPWSGGKPGPDRPWLVSTQNCGFFGNYEKGAKDSTLLRVDARAFALGVAFWQANADAYDVPAFTAALGATVPSARRPDVRWQWVDLWGENHVRSVSGPRTQSVPPVARLIARLRPGDVTAADLCLDPDYPPGKGPPDLGADPRKLGVNPAARVIRKR